MTMITVQDWMNSYADMPLVKIRNIGDVDGICKVGRGARFLYARVTLTFSPSDRLEFTNSTSRAKDTTHLGHWLKYVCLGVLDVMLVHPATPITGFRCDVKDLDFHDVDSTNEAFRLAGRDAAKRFLTSEQYAPQ